MAVHRADRPLSPPDPAVDQGRSGWAGGGRDRRALRYRRCRTSGRTAQPDLREDTRGEVVLVTRRRDVIW